MGRRKQMDFFGSGSQTTMLKRNQLRRDGGTQMRDQLSEEAIEQYTIAYRNGEKMPAIIVFNDGENFWIADGFHRDESAGRAGLDEIECEVRQGTVQDAIFYALKTANRKHGLQLNRASKRIKARRILLLADEAQKFNRVLEREWGLSESLFRSVRKELESSGELSASETQTRKGERNGKPIEMNTAKIGYANKATPYDPDNPLHVKALRGCLQGRLEEQITNGATNEQIKAQLSWQFGLGGSYTNHDVNGVAYKGGANPSVWFGVASSIGRPSIGGMKLIHTARELLSIPSPKTTTSIEEWCKHWCERLNNNVEVITLIIDGETVVDHTNTSISIEIIRDTFKKETAKMPALASVKAELITIRARWKADARLQPKPVAQFEDVLAIARINFKEHFEQDVMVVEQLLSVGSHIAYRGKSIPDLARYAAVELDATVSDALYISALRQIVDETDEEELADLAFDPSNRQHILDLLQNQPALMLTIQQITMKLLDSGDFTGFIQFNDETMGQWRLSANRARVQYWSLTDKNRPTFAFSFDDLCDGKWLPQWKLENAISSAAQTAATDLEQRITLLESWQQSPTTDLISLLPHPFAPSAFQSAIGAVIHNVRERQSTLALMFVQEEERQRVQAEVEAAPQLPMTEQETPPDVRPEPTEHPAHLYQFTDALDEEGNPIIEIRKWRVVNSDEDSINGWIYDIECDDETTSVYADTLDNGDAIPTYFTSQINATNHHMRQCDIHIQKWWNLQKQYERAGQVEFAPKETGLKIAQ